jgi:hypothetical protein
MAGNNFMFISISINVVPSTIYCSLIYLILCYMNRNMIVSNRLHIINILMLLSNFPGQFSYSRYKEIKFSTSRNFNIIYVMFNNFIQYSSGMGMNETLVNLQC